MGTSRFTVQIIAALVLGGCQVSAPRPADAPSGESSPVTLPTPMTSADPVPSQVTGLLSGTPDPSAGIEPALGGGWIAFIWDHRVFLIRPDGTEERAITPDDVCIADYRPPRWDPAGRRIALSVATSCDGDESEYGSSVALLDVDAGTLEPLGAPGQAGSPTEVYDWSPDGRLLLVGFGDHCPDGGCEGALATLDLESGDVRWLGRRRQGVDFGHADWSHDGSRVVYASGTEEGPGTMWLVDAESGAAAPVPLPRLPDGPALPVWSPDGASIAFWLNQQLHIVDAGGGNLRTVGDKDAFSGWKHAVGWSPDGSRIAFALPARVADDVSLQLHVASTDGSDVRQLTSDPASHDFLSWSPDGAWIVVNDPVSDDPHRMWLVAADGSGARELAIGSRPAWQGGPAAACCD